MQHQWYNFDRRWIHRKNETSFQRVHSSANNKIQKEIMNFKFQLFIVNFINLKKLKLPAKRSAMEIRWDLSQCHRRSFRQISVEKSHFCSTIKVIGEQTTALLYHTITNFKRLKIYKMKLHFTCSASKEKYKNENLHRRLGNTRLIVGRRFLPQ